MRLQQIFDIRLFAFLVLSLAASAAEPLPVGDFDTMSPGELAVQVSARARIPSSVKWALDEEIFAGDSGRSLRVEFVRLRGGEECALLIAIPGVDLSQYKSLSFQARGREGGELFDVGIGDAADAAAGRIPKTMVSLEKIVPGGLTDQWQTVSVPLEQLVPGGGLKTSSIVFDFNRITKYSVIYLDGIRFDPKQEDDAATAR